MKTKKFGALFLCLAVILVSVSSLCIGVSAETVQAQIDIPEGETYELNGVTYTVIRSAAEMNAAAAANASGGVHYILANDLVYSAETPFTRISLKNGSMNGNGYSIKGVTLAVTEKDDYGMGLFTTSKSQGCTLKISNLTVGAPDDPVVVASEYPSWGATARIGTLLGFINGTATIENVTVFADVSADSDYRAGGLIGEARGTLTMKNCVFNGSVSVSGTGGANFSVAGLIGNSWSLNVTMENCSAYGTVSFGSGYVAGLIGQMSNTAVLKNCANYASVSGGMAGGLIGDSGLKVTGKVTMIGCFNAGTVAGTSYAAGLIGGCSKRTDYPTVLTDCANIGTVSSDANAADLIARIDAPAALTLSECGAFGTPGAFTTGNKAAADSAISSSAISSADALIRMQTKYDYAMFGLEENRIEVKTVPAETKFLQYRKNTETNKMDLRLIGVLNTNDLAKYANVGFLVSVYQEGIAEPLAVCEPQTTTTVYQSIKANEDGTIREYSAAELGATYLYALELHNIPMSGTYLFKVTAFATEGDTAISDSVVSITVADGQIQ